MDRFHLRRGTAGDVRPVFDVFWASLWDLFERSGRIPPGVALDTDRAWRRLAWVVEYIASEAAEFWIAHDDAGPLGFSRSIERDGVLQLTELFVHPRNQSSGIGAALLDKAFPAGRGRHRSIVATMDPRALNLYLGRGVRFRTTLVDIEIEPTAHRIDTDLEFIGLDDLDDPIGVVGAIDRTLLDHERPADIEFFMTHRRGVAYRRGGEVVGYGFGHGHGGAGPILVADPADLPAALTHMENAAAEAGVRRIEMELSLGCGSGLDWLRARGHRIAPFSTVLLTSDPFLPHDRYVPFSPTLFF